MIGSNLRTLKRDGQAYVMKNNLCANCGYGLICEAREDDHQSCDVYQPVLMFKSLAGTETGFNTFRLGGSWVDRVHVGKLVALVDEHGEKIAEARVEAVRVGPRDEMIRTHSHQNHLILARDSRSPATDMARILRNLYGPNFLARAELITAIYLRRVEFESRLIARE